MQKGEPRALLVGMQTGAATVGNSMEVPQNVKNISIFIDLPYDPAVSLLGIYPQNTKTLIQRNTCTRMFITALFTIAKLWKQPKCPLIDEWINK